MNRYLTLLGVAIIVFSIAGGSIELSNSYNQYQSHFRVSGTPGTNPLTMLDEAQWQLARLVGGGIIMGGLISGSMLMALGWIGRILEQLRDALAEELREAPATTVQTSGLQS